jgi:hypothetical protein
MQPEQVIKHHLDICEQVHSLLLRENHQLKTEGTLPSEEILNEKEGLLPVLDQSLVELKKLNREDFSPFGEGGNLIRKAQNKLMQIFYIDRENEQLLHRAGTPQNHNSFGGKISEIRDIQSQLNRKEK